MVLASLLLAIGLQVPTTPPSVSVASPASTTPLVVGRRTALAQAAAAVTASYMVPLAAQADVRGVNENRPTNEKEANKLLTSLGFSQMKVPGGFTPIVQYIGFAPPANIDGFKAKERAFTSPLLVRFLCPSGWLIESPSITENGEAGNIGANNYIKGDSANFASAPLPGGEKLSSLGKPFFQAWLSSQMTKDVYEDVKVKKIKPVTQPDGTEMVIIEFGYTLLTRAGFTVLRQGVASALVADNAVVGVVAATTALRFKELSDTLQTTADSFRAYPVKDPTFAGGLI